MAVYDARFDRVLEVNGINFDACVIPVLGAW